MQKDWPPWGDTLVRVTQHGGGNTPVAGLVKAVLPSTSWGDSEKVGERTEGQPLPCHVDHATSGGQAELKRPA